ncbi:MAG TPA: TetR/AcrR family transcriptional regulator [Anaerolineales bacterium]|nr:TetR/AcrR family transcriptional regulator [Anaerolineales bacterium]
MQNLEDLRVRRTRKLLQQALLEAASEKGFAHITVRDIAERAMVNRATFYRHYEDKYDLLAHYIEELSELIDSNEEETSPGDQPLPSLETPPSGLAKLLRHMQTNANFYRVMLGKQGDPTFCAQSFRNYIEQGYRRILSSQPSKSDPSRPPIDLTVNYLIHAGIGAIVWWLENDQPCSPEQMAVWLYQLSRASISVSLVSGTE